MGPGRLWRQVRFCPNERGENELLIYGATLSTYLLIWHLLNTCPSPGTNPKFWGFNCKLYRELVWKELLWSNGESRRMSCFFCNSLSVIPDVTFTGRGSSKGMAMEFSYMKEKRFAAQCYSLRLSGTFVSGKSILEWLWPACGCSSRLPCIVLVCPRNKPERSIRILSDCYHMDSYEETNLKKRIFFRHLKTRLVLELKERKF